MSAPRFRNVTIPIRKRNGSEPEEVVAMQLPGSPWAVVNTHHSMHTVYHAPTGLAVQGNLLLKQARHLAVTLQDQHPDLPALAALPFGTAPTTETPEAREEALGLRKTIDAWFRENPAI